MYQKYLNVPCRKRELASKNDSKEVELALKMGITPF